MHICFDLMTNDTLRLSANGQTLSSDDRYTNCFTNNTNSSSWPLCYHFCYIYSSIVPGAKWFCTAQCEKSYNLRNARKVDAIQEYSFYATWLGLTILCHRDAERENDGPFLLTIWKVAQIGFANNKNHNYLELAHRMMAGKSFFMMIFKKIYIYIIK